jgi:NTP pyrophosphatase (non-canonical NTP hydrolase)
VTDVGFTEEFSRVQRAAYSTARVKGFQDREKDPLFVPTALALIMSEAAEALAEDRKGNREAMGPELADVVLRCMNLAEALKIDLGAEIEKKAAYNVTRPYKHGGKLY